MASVCRNVSNGVVAGRVHFALRFVGGMVAQHEGRQLLAHLPC